MSGNVTLKLSTNIITNNIVTGEDYSYVIKKGDVTVKQVVILMEVEN